MTCNEDYTAFMLDHAAGSLAGPLLLAGDVHIALSAQGQAMASHWDMIAGTLLETAPTDSCSHPRQKPKARPARALDSPDDIRQRAGEVRWRRGLSGVRYAPAGVRGCEFMQLQPGQAVPRHNHSTVEATIVLSGWLDVDGEMFGVGDLALGLPGQPHKPAARGNEPCICFVARGDKPFWRFS